MVWLSAASGRSIFPYCEIREIEGIETAYELVITYESDVRTVERFPTLAEASRRAQEVGRFWRLHRVRVATTAWDVKDSRRRKQVR
ncbi:MAG: hypothetical protein ACM36C_16550 [Acidobacteriota bacterium]